MSKFDDEVNELLNNPFLKKVEVDIIHKPDGTIELKGLKMDPNRPEVEKDLLDHAMRKIKDVRGHHFGSRTRDSKQKYYL